MSYEIIALDIDGTLTDSNKEITPKTCDALTGLMRRGKKVVLASGRPTPGLRRYAAKLRLDMYGGYLCSFNGARIINAATGEVIVNRTLPPEAIPQMYAFARDNHLGVVTYENDGVISAFPVDRYAAEEARLNGMPIRQVDHWDTYVTFPVNKCLMTGDGDHLAIMEKRLQSMYKDRYSIYRSEDYFLEIMPLGVDKADALSILLTHLGLTREQLAACGDGHNDLSMIKYAGLGVAMANAKDEIKKAADYVTLSNDQDGIAAVIEKFF